MKDFWEGEKEGMSCASSLLGSCLSQPSLSLHPKGAVAPKGGMALSLPYQDRRCPHRFPYVGACQQSPQQAQQQQGDEEGAEDVGENLRTPYERGREQVRGESRIPQGTQHPEAALAWTPHSQGWEAEGGSAPRDSPRPWVPLTVPVAGGDALLVAARGRDRPVGHAGLHAHAVLCDPEQLPDGELCAVLHHGDLQQTTQVGT